MTRAVLREDPLKRIVGPITVGRVSSYLKLPRETVAEATSLPVDGRSATGPADVSSGKLNESSMVVQIRGTLWCDVRIQYCVRTNAGEEHTAYRYHQRAQNAVPLQF